MVYIKGLVFPRGECVVMRQTAMHLKYVFCSEQHQQFVRCHCRVQFGLVFFAMAILVAICLSLGNRSEGELSAYSVFNPNCERLLGQMTAEHFERDVLRRRID
ncbi:hypothetical protein Aduo_015338 [Ancylostoma duodenale]